MNKRFWFGFIVVVIYVILYEWGFHGGILESAYKATASVWRPEESMQAFMPWMMTGQLLFSFVFCLLFTFTRCQTNIKDGISYGLVIGLLMSSASLIYYTVLPIPLSLLVWWVLGGVLETCIAGALFASVYQREGGINDNG